MWTLHSSDDTPAAVRVIAIFGPTGVGKTEVAIALAERLRAGARTRSRSRPTRCRSTPASRSSPARRARASRRGSSTGSSASCPSPRRSAPGAYARARARRDRRRSSPPAGGRSWSAAPASTCAPRSPTSTCARRPTRRARALARRADRARPGARCTRCSPSVRPRPRPGSRRPTRSGSCARSSCSKPASSRAAAGGDSQLWTTRDAPPDAARRARDGPRRAARAHRRARRRDGRRGRDRRGRAPPRPRRVARPRARRWASRSCSRGDVEAMKARTRRYAKRQLTWMRKLPGVAARSTSPAATPAGRRGRAARHDHRLMRFEKWQALGNDYLIVEAATPRARPRARARAVRPPPRRRAPTACSRSRRPTSPATSRACGSSTRTAREAELSGNGAREAILYLRARGWTDARHVLDPDARGRDPRDDHRRAHLPRRHGPRLAALRTSRGGPDGRGELGRLALPARPHRQPAVRDPRRRPRRARGARPAPRSGPRIERAPLFPNRTNVSFWTELAPDRIRARIFERGVGETLSSRHRRLRRGGRARAARRRLAGHRRARRRRADVDVDEALHVDLEGWAAGLRR